MSIYQDPTFADYWNRRAGAHGEPYKKDILDPIMFDLIGSLQNQAVLEMGCGNGYLGRKFLDQKPARLIMTDISAENIRYTQEKLAGTMAEFITMDITQPWIVESNSIDVIYSNMVLNEIADIKTPATEAYRALRDHGQFIFSVTHPAWDLYIYGQELAGITSRKIRGAKGYFDRGFTQFMMGGSHSRQELPSQSDQEFAVEHYQRPLSDYFNSLVEAGFQVQRIVEPQLTPEFLAQNPRFKEYLPHPIGLIFYAVK